MQTTASTSVTTLVCPRSRASSTRYGRTTRTATARTRMARCTNLIFTLNPLMLAGGTPTPTPTASPTPTATRPRRPPRPRHCNRDANCHAYSDCHANAHSNYESSHAAASSHPTASSITETQIRKLNQESGKQEPRKGISEIEGKAATVATSENGSRRVQSRKGISEKEGITAKLAARDNGC